jgi:xanthine/CO dehydrogenase XdhC/CoxF family maturation factor
MKKILKETIRLLENEIAVVWATVVEHKGSTPRKVASRMLIRSNGESRLRKKAGKHFRDI